MCEVRHDYGAGFRFPLPGDAEMIGETARENSLGNGQAAAIRYRMAKQMICWNVFFQTKLVKQCVLLARQPSHHGWLPDEVNTGCHYPMNEK